MEDVPATSNAEANANTHENVDAGNVDEEWDDESVDELGMQVRNALLAIEMGRRRPCRTRNRGIVDGIVILQTESKK